MEVWNKDEGVPDTRVLAMHEARFGQLAGTIHMGKNKSLVSSASTNVDLKSILSIPMVCVKMQDTALSRG